MEAEVTRRGLTTGNSTLRGSYGPARLASISQHHVGLIVQHAVQHKQEPCRS